MCVRVCVKGKPVRAWNRIACIRTACRPGFELHLHPLFDPRLCVHAGIEKDTPVVAHSLPGSAALASGHGGLRGARQATEHGSRRLPHQQWFPGRALAGACLATAAAALTGAARARRLLVKDQALCMRPKSS